MKNLALHVTSCDQGRGERSLRLSVDSRNFLFAGLKSRDEIMRLPRNHKSGWSNSPEKQAGASILYARAGCTDS